MPKRTDIKSILIIGAGPIIIGQACEFDYAGTQALLALKAEGYRIILVNSNPATIMTDPTLADATYIEPITVEFLERIIAKEKPDALLPTLGGQTALNCTLALAKAGVLEKYKVEVIGATLKAIELAENRANFQKLMTHIGLDVPKAYEINSLTDAHTVIKNLTLPVLVRSSYTLGGGGAGIAHTETELLAICEQAFAEHACDTLMIDEALIGWKEYELEVIRDCKDNCIIVCGIENIDPLGVHTGDSITVAPIQTLTDKEYQVMRKAAFQVLRAVGVETGGSNVQFAVHPQTGRMVVIEMNPRVSRSSALASKASGYPIAKIAAKLAVGYSLDELSNDITAGKLPASFEPTLDYVVVKIPRFNFDKFPNHAANLGPQMFSVGEVMAIGSNFSQSLQKAMRSLELGFDGLSEIFTELDDAALTKIVASQSPTQLWAIAESFRRGFGMDEIYQSTHIDHWFLQAIKSLVDHEQVLKQMNVTELTFDIIKQYKQLGFSDTRLASLLNVPHEEISKIRAAFNIYPVYKRVDSCAGEFATLTAYLYSTYDDECEAQVTQNKKIMIIGSGPNRIGQGIEFDYCCVQAALALKAAGIETIMVNCNPETVSTDYDVVDRLYNSPLTIEDVLAIIALEKPAGVLVQFGGQTPLHLAEGLAHAGVNLLGLPLETIQQTEDRKKFQQLLSELQLQQPRNVCIHHLSEVDAAIDTIGFPMIVRPSFVIGGKAMAIAHDKTSLLAALKIAFAVDSKQPVLLEAFLQNAIELDVDAITDGKDVYVPALLQHIEAAGVHSGDSACITPPTDLSLKLQKEIVDQVKKIAQKIAIRGMFNVQLAVAQNNIYVLEVNPRASRTLPFLCKVTGLPLVQMATECILGINKKLPREMSQTKYFSVKEAVFPFKKFTNSNINLGPEMKSTGESMGIGATANEAYAKAQIAAGNILPTKGFAIILSDIADYPALSTPLISTGFTVVSSYQPTDFKKFNLVIVINNHEAHKPLLRYAIDHNICYATTHAAAHALVAAVNDYASKQYDVCSLQEHYSKTTAQKHLLTGEEFSAPQLLQLIDDAIQLKAERAEQNTRHHLQGQTLALLFDKPSLRTRFSFTIAMRELGGDVVESVSSTRKSETPEDHAQVLSGYCHGIMVRTHEDSELLRMSKVSRVPIINGLTNLHHPCQIFADLMTLKEVFHTLTGLTVCYVGDGNNILHSLLLLSPQLGINIHYACPEGRGPDAQILAQSKKRSNKAQIVAFETPSQAVKDVDAVYTDVWTSMGFEAQADDALFANYQVNESLMQHAKQHAIFMHCLPMERGKEVNETLPDSRAAVIYQQSENRLHVQKALLLQLLSRF